ncbi:MAG: hypothetical protein AVDCRST_MAG19-3917 [uncultured Thermomicrobiales bacterium]|uniref:Uncharacterized protein n=1 Tax=uncultured Thermomicrobiales bacterium TaxID=1645740 RepID=A0A6J4VND2_9BACT|nr:MAG: hypothetical protein AVDCRST_MAG19-3917 [uncultured Thermomicrobiales bacterium]
MRGVRGEVLAWNPGAGWARRWQPAGGGVAIPHVYLSSRG